jgi:hypothetical protein
MEMCSWWAVTVALAAKGQSLLAVFQSGAALSFRASVFECLMAFTAPDTFFKLCIAIPSLQ